MKNRTDAQYPGDSLRIVDPGLKLRSPSSRPIIRAVRTNEKFYRSLEEIPSARRANAIRYFTAKTIYSVIEPFFSIPYKLIYDVSKNISENKIELDQELEQLRMEELEMTPVSKSKEDQIHTN